MTKLVVNNLRKSYGASVAIEDISFTVEDGEFVTLLGPSGCGKSTILASIAGLQFPDRGQIVAGDSVFFDAAKKVTLPAEARNLGLVFQSYALWPHMSVRQNLEFPLKLRGIPRSIQEKRIANVLELVEMGALSERYPHELSGGQQQRVALARTLVYEPSILLLDEPLSNLDAKLRERARTWLADIRDRIKLTTVYVTHDHGEALSLSDRIVVMNKGKIMQVGTPREIYETPANPFVADFIGSTNFLHGKVCDAQVAKGTSVIELNGGQKLLSRTHQSHQVGHRVSVAVRPERLELLDGDLEQRADTSEGTVVEVDVLQRSYFGAHWHYEFQLGQDLAKISSQKENPSSKVKLFFPKDACRVFEVSSETSATQRPSKQLASHA